MSTTVPIHAGYVSTQFVIGDEANNEWDFIVTVKTPPMELVYLLHVSDSEKNEIFDLLFNDDIQAGEVLFSGRRSRRSKLTKAGSIVQLELNSVAGYVTIDVPVSIVLNALIDRSYEEREIDEDERPT